MLDSQKYASDFVAEWVDAHKAEIGGNQLRFDWREEYSRMFCAEFETSTHLLQFCAWDHAFCLDIQALNKATGNDDYIVAGECNGFVGLSERLNQFLKWLKENEKIQKV